MFLFLLYTYARVMSFIRRYLFHRPDYKIVRAYLDYVHVPVTQEDLEFDPVFKNEVTYWDDETDTSHSVEITKYAREGTVGDIVIPTSVEKCLVSLSYLYSNRTYTFFTRDMNYMWPPVNPNEGARFIIPIKSASLLDEDLDYVRDVTGKIKKYAGPYNDFFNQDVTPNDMFTFDDYKFLRILNFMNKECVIPCDSFIRLPC